MAITNASTLAEYASGISTQGATLTVDANNKRVGIGTTNPQAMLQVGTGVTVFGNAGIASFTSLKLSGETDSTSTTTGALTVTGGVGIGLSLTVGGDVSVGGTITYEDVTNVDSLGIVTARSGLRVVGGGVTCVGVATFFNDIQVGDKIIHNGDTNTAIRFADADTITAETGGSERVRIASDGDVIIGGSSDAGYTNYADNLTIHGTGNEGITIRSGTTSQGAIYFSDATGSGTGTYEGNIIYDHNINALLFGSNHVERFRIGSGGIIEIRSNMQTIGDQNIIRFTDTDTSVSAGQTMGRLQWYSSDASGGGACVKAEIEAVCTDTTPDAFLAFKTHDGSGTTPETRLKITSAGRLLLGTTVDSVFNGGRNASFQQEGTSSATSALAITRNSNDANPAYLSLGKSRGTSVGANTAVQNGDDIGTIEFNAGDGSGSFNAHALIKGSVDGAPGNSDAPGRISFWTTPDGGSTTPAERVRIDSSGRLLIGTTTPGESSADDLTIGDGTQHTGMTIRCGTAQWGSIFFSDGTSGLAQYDGSIE